MIYISADALELRFELAWNSERVLKVDLLAVRNNKAVTLRVRTPTRIAILIDGRLEPLEIHPLVFSGFRDYGYRIVEMTPA